MKIAPQGMALAGRFPHKTQAEPLKIMPRGNIGSRGLQKRPAQR